MLLTSQNSNSSATTRHTIDDIDSSVLDNYLFEPRRLHKAECRLSDETAKQTDF